MYKDSEKNVEHTGCPSTIFQYKENTLQSQLLNLLQLLNPVYLRIVETNFKF